MDIDRWKVAASGSGSAAEAALVRHLARYFRAEGSCSQTLREIAEALGLSAGGTGAALRRLVDRGWVQVTHPTNGNRQFTTYHPTMPAISSTAAKVEEVFSRAR